MDSDLDILNSKILIIDDEPINIELLMDFLENEEYENLTGVTDPKEGIEHYRETDFDLVLLDINMPGLDGFQVMEAFKDIKKKVAPPILVLTALKDQKTCNKALTHGATDFLGKPFDPDEAINRINNMLVSYCSRKQLFHLNTHLESLVTERTQELLETKLKVIHHLSYAAEYRDTETAAHTIRVGEYAKLLGQKLGFDEEHLTLLHNAAPLHDIGKIGIPDAILLKPGKFEGDEWQIMKTHTNIGVEILQENNDPLILTAKVIALTHHEKWDGSGYPNGISGEGIPIDGRIVMIADVYDALTMERPYKKAWSEERAIELIKSESGKSFDPGLVKLFLESVKEFSEIRKKYVD